MGNFEKLVVLTVLFLVAIVLGVSLNTSGGDEVSAAGPLDASRAVLDERGQGAGAKAVVDASMLAGLEGLAGADRGRTGAGAEREKEQPLTLPLIDASVRAVPRGSILETMEGLTPSASESYCVYECQPGDTWELLAKRYYGSDAPQYIAHFTRNNEGQKRAPIGARILVPVFDLEQPGGSRPAARAAGTDAAVAARPQPVAIGARGTHVVEEGDSLWKISKRYYGTGEHWGDVYEANRSSLADPGRLELGMTLVLPDVGATTTKPAAKNTASAPVSAPASKPAKPKTTVH